MASAPSPGAPGAPSPPALRLRLAAVEVELAVPPEARAEFGDRFVAPAHQPGPVRARWAYEVRRTEGAGLRLAEGGDPFARAEDAAQAVQLVERRLVARLLDHCSRRGWLVVSGRLDEVDGTLVLTLGGADDGSRTLLRDGEALALPLPLPRREPIPGPGRLEGLVVADAEPGAAMPTAAAMSSVVAAVQPPGSPPSRRLVREVSAALRGVRARGPAADGS